MTRNELVQAEQLSVGLMPSMTPQQIVAMMAQRVEIVQTVMDQVMRPGVDYGKIPGTDGTSLLKPGAEKLALAFALAPKFSTEDLSTDDSVRYRCLCELISRETGLVVSTGQGEASSDEERYRFRRAVNHAEFEATDASRRRIKYGRGGRGKPDYTIEQVRTNPADVANTVLKQAEKRAFVGAIRTATAASDLFSEPDEKAQDGGTKTGPTMLAYLIELAKQKGLTEQDILSKLSASCSDGTLATLPYIKAESFAKWLAGKPDVVEAEATDEQASDSEDDDFDERFPDHDDDADQEGEGQQSLEG